MSTWSSVRTLARRSTCSSGARAAASASSTPPRRPPMAMAVQASMTMPAAQALAQLRPLNAYGWSKHVVDQRIARLRHAGGALPPQCVGLKFFNVYGPNEYHKGAMQSVVARNFAARAAAASRCGCSAVAGPTTPTAASCATSSTSATASTSSCGCSRNRRFPACSTSARASARSWLDLATHCSAPAQRPARVEFIDMPAELREKYQYFTEAA